MTSFRYTPPCPPVQEGDAGSFVARARWFMDYGGPARGDAEPDLRRAMALDPSLWEPWWMLAELVSDDPDLRLHRYDEAIRRGGGAGVELRRAHHLFRLDRFTEAEQAFSRILDEDTSDSFGLALARRDRAIARVQIGDYAGAVSDMSRPGLGPVPSHVREWLGRLQWIAGDLAGAYQTFTAGKTDKPEFFRIWAHLCQVAHGLRHSAMPSLGPAEKAPVVLSGACVCMGPGGLNYCDTGPPQPAVSIWDVLTDLFLDRITPDDVWVVSRSALAASKVWLSPESEDAWLKYGDYRPSYVWRSELLFFIGMWYLSKDDHERARQALNEAAQDDRSCSLERIAAREQLRRISESAASEAVPFRPLEPAPPPPPHPHLQKFVELDLSLPELWPTRGGPTLKFDAHDLGDKGLATLVASRNLRYVVRLLLQGNGITAAGMAAFRRSSFVVNIAELDLSGNAIGDEGVRQLLGSVALLALESLDLSDTGLTESGALLLLDQEHLQLQHLILGNTPLDMPVWLRLAERYGAALYARGIFRTPYVPPFNPNLLVCFSSKMSEPVLPGPNSGGSCELTFLMRDHVADRWRWAAGGRSKGMRPYFLDEVRSVRDFEKDLAGWSAKVYPLEGYGGFTLIRQGCRPLSLKCPACASTYVWPRIEVEPGEGREADRFRCPKGHVL